MPAKFPEPAVEAATAQEPTLDQNLELMAQRMDRLEAEVEAIAGVGTYPEWWYEDTIPAGVLRQQLSDPEADPRTISTYFRLYDKELRLRAIISGRKSYNSSLTMVCDQLGASVVARGFKAEHQAGPMHVAMLDMLAHGADEHEYGLLLDMLSHAYHTGTRTGLLGLGNASASEYDQSLKPLLRTENAIRAMRLADRDYGHESTDEETRSNTNKWMSQALMAATGLSDADATAYTFAASRTSDDKNLIGVLDRFDHFGVERLRDLEAFTGIQAFEDYSVAQLELMEDLLRNPVETAKRLKDHDVTVMMVNRVGDGTGILKNAAELFEDGKGRTLAFEIRRMEDIPRRMLQLEELDVEASTLVLVAHNAPGQFIVADVRDAANKRRDIAAVAGRNLVKFINSNGLLEPGDHGYSMHGMKDVARIVEHLMRPSRGIDDAEEDIGRKKILFQACDAATEVDSKDRNEEGEVISLGMASVASQLGVDLLNSGVKSSVDIYGAPNSIQLHKSKGGVRYTSKPTHIEGERQPQHAIRIRLENGKLTRQEVDEVPMHN